MKIGVSVYSFHGYRETLGTKGCIDKVKEFGGEGVDFVEDKFDTQEEYLAYAKDIGDYCKQVGIEAVCFCVGSDFLNGSGGDIDAEIERVKKLVDIAEAFGCKLIRHDATYGYPAQIKHSRGFDNALPKLIQGYRAVTEYAQKKGIKTCVENHGHFAQDAQRIEKLINGVAHDNFGALVDIGNFTCADEYQPASVALLAPYAFHAHAKDFHIKKGTDVNPGDGYHPSRGGNFIRGSIIGHGNVPVTQCINNLRRLGYDEYLMIEFEGMEDPLKGIEIGVKNLKRFIG
ncbi:sugar phosphate isomerase/epimerase [Eubacteriales bacterium OttesenSCG-928-G02]|nr:sugar phosphate isomerase/epimerase [Eubacteriales bacterium OttesenSCG-928-G02]